MTTLRTAAVGIALGIALVAGPVSADMITTESPHSVKETADRFVAAVEKAGARVFARIDHAAGAAKAGQALAPSEVIIFGNPKLGTPAIQASATMGLDLPLRVLFYTGPDGKSLVVWHQPSDISQYHGIAADHPAVLKMRGAMEKLTGAAVSP